MTGPALTVEQLQRRVLEYARQAVAAGIVSERRLAHLAGWSQPHMHHVLARKCDCSAEIADSIIRALGISALDLYTIGELRAIIDASVETTRARLQAELDLAGAESGCSLRQGIQKA